MSGRGVRSYTDEDVSPRLAEQLQRQGYDILNNGEMNEHSKHDAIAEGEAGYQHWRTSLVDTPEKQAAYDEIAAKSELWLQLVEARQAAGLTQAELAKRLGISQSQVSRIEKRGYDAYTLNTLRKYVKALGDSFRLEVRVIYPHSGAGLPDCFLR